MPKVEVSSAKGTKRDAIALGWFEEESKGKGKDPSVLFLGDSSDEETQELCRRVALSKHFYGKAKEVSLLRYYAFGHRHR